MLKRLASLLLLVLAFGLSAPASATISTLASQITVAGNNSQTVFQFPFTVGSTSEIALIETSSSGVQTTIPPSQYLVALNPIQTGFLWPVGGSVTFPLSGSPIAAGTTLTIMRVLPLTQNTALSNLGNFYPSAVEEGLDTGVMQTQQVAAKNGTIRGTWLPGTAYNYGDIVTDGPSGANTGNLYACAIANTSATWSTDLAAGDWVLVLNIQSIVNVNPAIANNYLFGNISGISAAPYGVSASAFLNSAFGNTQGDILYQNGSGWVVLPPGTNGQVLKTQGAGANPVWGSTSGTGTVTSVSTGTGLTGGPITSAGTLSLATIANNALLANTSGSTSAPGATTVSALLDSVFGTTQGAILYRGGTVWSALAPGTSGYFLETQGSAANPTWSAPAGGIVTVTIQSFSSSGTYTPHAGNAYDIVECVGGGGGAGGGASSSGSSGGGGAGGYARVAVAAPGSQTVTIGGGGAGGNSSGNTGGTGVTTSFGSLCVAAGGVGTVTNSTSYSVGGGGGVGSTGTFTATGGVGGIGLGTNASGSGGTSYFGGGGAALVSTGSGNNGTACGSGGGGALSGGNTSGGSGAAGCVIVTEYNTQ